MARSLLRFDVKKVGITLKNSMIMKMRKLVWMAMASLGLAAAFASCSKDDKVYDAPKIEFRDADSKVITDFTEANQKIQVVVTLGNDDLKIKSSKATVKTPSSVLESDLKLNFTKVNAGADKGKFVAEFDYKDTKINNEKDPAIEVTITDTQGKSTTATLKYKAESGSGQEPSKGTPAVEKKGWVNNDKGAATGGFSLTQVKAVASDDNAADVVNVSVEKQGLAPNLKSNTGMQFAKVDAGTDYANATKEAIAALGTKATYAADITGLKENDLFIAKNKTGDTFYLFKVTKIGPKDKDFDGVNEKDMGSTKGNGGYMTFGFKSNK